MAELAEEFRLYARRGGQVMISTHSPDFLNATELDEVFWLVKRNGYTEVCVSGMPPIWLTAIKWVICGNKVFGGADPQ